MSMLRPNIFNRLRTGISTFKIQGRDFPFLDSGNNKNARMLGIKQTWLLLDHEPSSVRSSSFYYKVEFLDCLTDNIQY